MAAQYPSYSDYDEAASEEEIEGEDVGYHSGGTPPLSELEADPSHLTPRTSYSRDSSRMRSREPSRRHSIQQDQYHIEQANDSPEEMEPAEVDGGYESMDQGDYSYSESEFPFGNFP